MYNAVLVRYGEIGVKGRIARRRAEDALARALREALRRRGVESRVEVTEGRIIIWSPSDVELAVEAARRVFGVKSVSPAHSFGFEGLDHLVKRAVELFSERVREKKFMVRARRVGDHDFTSKDIERVLGAELLKAGAKKVDLEDPEITVYVELRRESVFLYDTIIEGVGGMAPATEGTVLVLFSGGFDSTVAAWRLMRRGAKVHLVHYDLGYPYVVKTAVKIGKKLAEWSYNYKMKMYIVNFKGPLMLINSLVSPHYRVLVLRRLMMEHAVELAKKIGAEAIATGESVGQVASQTLRNMMMIGGGLALPVLRPLAGSDKEEIIKETMKIGTYELNERQIEVCGLHPPTPHANEENFWREYEKVTPIAVPEPIEVDIGSEEADLETSAYRVGRGGS